MTFDFTADVTEAVSALGYLKPEFTTVLVALMPRCIQGEHPHAVARAVRREGTQISLAEKRELGLRANAFMSVEALAMMTDKGRSQPLEAIENTLLRASFRHFRLREIQRARDMPREIGCPVSIRLTGVFPDCPGCHRLNKRITDPDLVEAEFPIPGCARDACAVIIEIEVDYHRRV